MINSKEIREWEERRKGNEEGEGKGKGRRQKHIKE